MSDPLRVALALLNDALTVQRFPCRHKGIGMPGCVICDPRVYPGVLAALRATPETASPDAKSTASDARVSHDTLTVETLTGLLQEAIAEARYMHGLAADREIAERLLPKIAALGEEKP